MDKDREAEEPQYHPSGGQGCSALLKGWRADGDHQKGWERESWEKGEGPPQTHGGHGGRADQEALGKPLTYKYSMDEDKELSSQWTEH